MMIHENLSLGIDLGIGSCGWALLDWADEDAGGKIVGMGSWIFDVPETSEGLSKRKPTNQIRRTNRLMRRVTRRRARRMKDIRKLFVEHGLLSGNSPDALKRKGCDPWELRARALDKPLAPHELAIALGHVAKHRGFKSNAKRDMGANAADDNKKMLKAIETTAETLARYRTVGEMFAREPEFSDRKRNRDGDYSRTVKRDDLAAEVTKIFERQRALGSTVATAALEDAFNGIAFFQRPLQDSEHLVGLCPFESSEKRASKQAYSFELFRLLTRLVNLRIQAGSGERALDSAEIASALGDFAKQKSLTYKTLRTRLKLDDDTRFAGVNPDDEGRDVASRTGSSAEGSYALRKALGESVWASLVKTPATLDTIAFILAFRETVDSIEAGFKELVLEPVIHVALMDGVRGGKFGMFKGAAHISAMACRAMVPHIAAGKRYDEACDLAGYNYAERTETTISDINNPIARKALLESMKQIRALVNVHGLPGRIHIELARDVGKSLEERQDIERGIDKRTAQKKKLREEAKELLGLERVNGETLMRYELWKEQNGRCLYTDREIHPRQLVDSDNSVQVDHILPWSRFGDDSFVNKTLCLASANQRKKGRTPFEWFTAEKAAEDWDRFVARVETAKALKGRKKRNYILKSASEVEEKFRSRNLNDTRYAARLLADAAKRLYPEEPGKRRVFTRPGPLTAALRQAWGLEGLKKINGERIPDDRHHALDALVVAAVTEGELNKLTRSYQLGEKRGEARSLGRVDEPWEGFREDARTGFEKVFVARPERRRARGEGHAATIRQVVETDNGTVVFERKAIEKLTEKDLDLIKDGDSRNKALVDALRNWIAAGKPADALPRSPKGDVIGKVKVRTKKKPDVLVRGGAADRGEMVRVDVFTKPNKKGKDEYYLVPIYRHQVADKVEWPEPPKKAVSAHKPELEWSEMTSEFRFRFALHSMSLIEIARADGTVVYGYYRGLDRDGGQISISNPANPMDITPRIGTRTLHSFRKFAIDRLGNVSEIAQETRTWHGVACI